MIYELRAQVILGKNKTWLASAFVDLTHLYYESINLLSTMLLVSPFGTLHLGFVKPNILVHHGVCHLELIVLGICSGLQQHQEKVH